MKKLLGKLFLEKKYKFLNLLFPEIAFFKKHLEKFLVQFLEDFLGKLLQQFSEKFQSKTPEENSDTISGKDMNEYKKFPIELF